MAFMYRKICLLSLWLWLPFSYADDITYLVIQKQSEPLQIITEDGFHSGVITDLVREIFRDSEHRLQIEAMPFKEIQRRVAAGEYNNWLIYGARDWSPPQNINLTSTPVFTARHRLLVAKNSNFDYLRIDSLFDETLALLVGFDYPGLDSYLASGAIDDVRMVAYRRVFMELLSRRRLAGFVEMDSRLRYQLKQVREQGMRVAEQDFTFHDFSAVIPDYDIHLALDPAMPAHIQQFIDQRLRLLRRDGTVQAIMASYR